MSASSIQKAQMILVGGSANITTTSLTSSTFTANTGEIGIFNKQGTRLTESSILTTDEFVLAVSRGSTLPPLVSDVINKDRIREIKASVWVTDADQIDYIGYNGSTQSIDITNAGELYMAQINLIEFLTGTNNTYIKHGVYKSAIADGQAEISRGLAKSVNLNFAREAKNSSGDPKIKAYSVCSDAGSAVGAAADTVVGVKGSIYVTVTDTAANASVNAIAAGDFFRAGTAVTAPVYKVIASTVGTGGGILTLDEPLRDAVSLVGNTSEFITAALGAAADWGVKLVGQPYNFDPTKDKFRKVRWKLVLNDTFDSTIVTNSVAPTEGQGNYEQIASLENFLFGYRGEMYRNEQPWLFTNNYSASSSVAGGGYDVITIKFDSGVTNFKESVSEKQLILAVPVTSPTYVTGSDDITDVLECAVSGATTGNLAI